MEAAKRSETYQNEIWAEAVAQARATAEELGAEFIEVDKKPFQDAVAPMFDDFRKDPDQGRILDMILDVAKG